MPFGSELGTSSEGRFTCHAAYEPQDPVRPLRYVVDVFGRVDLSGFIRRIGATSSVAAGARIIICDAPLPKDPFPDTKGYVDFMIRGSEGLFGLTILGVGETLSGVAYPRGAMVATCMGAVTLTQGVSWFSFDGFGYRI